MNQEDMLKRFDREPRCALLPLKSVLEKVKVHDRIVELPLVELTALDVCL